MQRFSVLFVFAITNAATACGADHPLSADDRKEIAATNKTAIEKLTLQIAQTPELLPLYSRRGDAYFFAGQFKKAIADYDQMVKLDRSVDRSHWRRGIALFYAKDYSKASAQFERYHSFDNIDRENGIWRFFSQFKAHGKKVAQQGLLKYRKDDREPFPSVYELFSEKQTPQDVLQKIESAVSAKRPISRIEEEKRLFYAHLYIGLNYTIQNKSPDAIRHLKKAVANKWGRRSAYGPNYMWHVGRLQLNQLLTENHKQKQAVTPDATRP